MKVSMTTDYGLRVRFTLVEHPGCGTTKDSICNTVPRLAPFAYPTFPTRAMIAHRGETGKAKKRQVTGEK